MYLNTRTQKPVVEYEYYICTRVLITGTEHINVNDRQYKTYFLPVLRHFSLPLKIIVFMMLKLFSQF